MSASTPETQALALFRAGRMAQAEAAWRSILERKPDDAEALHVLGFILARTGRLEEGLALIDRSVERAPRMPAFLDNRAQVLADAGRLEDAIRDLRRALQIEPRFLPALLHLGGVLHRAGRLEEALAAFRRALALDPANADAHYNAGCVLLAAGKPADAEVSFRHALDRDPAHAMAWNNLGLASQQSDRLAQAIDCYRRATALQPALVTAWVNLGTALKDQGELDAAFDAYSSAIALGSASADVCSNAASVALDRGDMASAKALYARALRLRPGWAEPMFGLAQAELREGDFANGWDGWEKRFETDPPQATGRTFAIPRLTRDTLDSCRRVAVWSEQGVGDQVLYSTLLPELATRGVEAVVETDARLLPLYRRSLPQLRFTSPEESAQAFADCDHEIPIGSLPGLFRRSAEDFARQPPALLKPDPARVESFREKLGPGRWFAISWRSLQKGDRRALAARKSIPLEEFAIVARTARIRLLDVQYGAGVDEERRLFAERHPGLLARLPELDVFHDLEGLAAALAACEGVITASNVTAHIAGALGIPTWLAYLDGWPPFAYWAGRDDGRALWYPSVRIATRPGSKEWSAVFERIAADLRA